MKLTKLLIVLVASALLVGLGLSTYRYNRCGSGCEDNGFLGLYLFGRPLYLSESGRSNRTVIYQTTPGEDGTLQIIDPPVCAQVCTRQSWLDLGPVISVLVFWIVYLIWPRPIKSSS